MVRSFRRTGRKQSGTNASRDRHAVRATIQRSEASLASQSMEYGIWSWDRPQDGRQVWRKRATVEDMKTWSTALRSTMLEEADEAIIVALRRHELLPLKDCHSALQSSIPHLTRSPLFRCLHRHDSSRLPDVEGDKPKRQHFKRYPSVPSKSTSSRCRPPKASSSSSRPSTAPTRSPSLKSLQQPTGESSESSYSTCPKPCPIKSTSC